MLEGEDKSILITGFPTDNKGGVLISCYFSEDSKSVCIVSHDLIAVEPAQKAKFYERCSKLNREYGWVKFFVDERDNSVTVQVDALIHLKSCGEEILNLIFAAGNIADQAYADFLR